MAADVSAEMVAAMAAVGDEPMADSTFGMTKSGATIERVEGRLAFWTASNVSGEWIRTANYKWAGPGAAPDPSPTPT